MVARAGLQQAVVKKYQKVQRQERLTDYPLFPPVHPHWNEGTSSNQFPAREFVTLLKVYLSRKKVCNRPVGCSRLVKGKLLEKSLHEAIGLQKQNSTCVMDHPTKVSTGGGKLMSPKQTRSFLEGRMDVRWLEISTHIKYSRNIP